MRDWTRTGFLVMLALGAPTLGARAQLTVEAVVAQDVVDREPVAADSVFAAADGQVVCWSRITGTPEGGTTIHHVWIWGDEELADVTLNVGGSPWRTWSRKTLVPEWAGAWRVEIRDDAGTVLETLRFRVE